MMSKLELVAKYYFPRNLLNVNKGLKDYIDEAGGFTDNARQSKTYVLYLNGKAAATKHFLFFRSYPKVRPGSEIIIPKEIVKTRQQRRSATETIGLATALSSLAYIVIALIRL